MSPRPFELPLHYRLVEKIGAGGMGEIWKRLDTNLDRIVAIKILDGTARQLMPSSTSSQFSYPQWCPTRPADISLARKTDHVFLLEVL